MKKIEAIIRPEKFQALRDELASHGFLGLTVTEVAGTGKQKGQTGVFRGTSYEVKVLPKIKIELVLPQERADEVIDVIIDTCHTDQIGDGKIFVYNVEDVVRIRTKERGKPAVL